MRDADIIVVGGGIAGLATSAFAARGGMRTLVLERAAEPGGVARTNERDGFRLNLGPRALYPPAARLLDELGVRHGGARPALTGYLISGGRLHPMPRGADALLETSPVEPKAARAAAEAINALFRSPADSLDRISFGAFAETVGADGFTRAFLNALVRLTAYVDAPDLISAGAARAFLAEARGGVRYVDDGWQTIVDGLAHVATRAGVAIRCRSRVTTVLRDRGGVAGVLLADGTMLRAPNVVLAVDPDVARALLAPAGGTVPPTVSVRAAVLDLALTRLPNPDGGFIVALDRPLYLSVHSLAAHLAPDDGAVVHVARYVRPDERPDAVATRRELEALMDLVQPGWRRALAHARFLPDITVTHALPSATTGGLRGRPTVAVDALPGAFLAGDWAGDEHQLAGAALASAKRAATLARERLAAPFVPAV